MGKKENIGSFLKKKRENSKLTIEEVAQKTKINLNILKHLESNELDKLPNKTYVRGFVKSVAKLLSIDIEEALSVLELAYQPEQLEESNKANEVKPAPASQPKVVENTHSNDDDINELQDKLSAMGQSIFNKKVIYPVLILAVVGIILKGIVSFFVQLSNEEKQIANIKENKSETKVVEEVQDPSIKGQDENLFDIKATKNLQIEDKAEENTDEKVEAKIEAPKVVEKKPVEEKKVAVVKEEPKKVETAVEEEKDEVEEEKKAPPKKLSAGGKFPFKKFYPAPANMYEIMADAKENSDETLLPGRFKNAIEAGKENIYIHATSGDTWISYQSDDNEIKRFVLKQGRSVLIKGDVILLFMGNINVAHIYYNNKLIKTESKTGVKSLIFPESEAPNYELPLFPAFNGVPYKASEYKANMEENQDA